jgi:hypothetical protein
MKARFYCYPFGRYDTEVESAPSRAEIAISCGDGSVRTLLFVLDEARMRAELAAGETVEGCGYIYRLESIQ